MAMQKILVTGGAGFIGSNFLYSLLEKYPDCQPVCLDALTYAGNLATLEPALRGGRLAFERVDITDRPAVNALFDKYGFDGVVNFAAESHVDRSIETPEVFLRTNILGTQVLMDACLSHGNVRFHQVGTDEVYGDLPLDRPDLKFTEETPLHASSPYSASKASADLLVLAYCRTFGLNATITRCSNNYGPYHFPEKLIPLMIINALHDKPLPVYGTGRNVRDWLYVAYHCAAIDRVLRAGRPGEVYNVGGNSERTNLQVVERILEILGKPRSLIRFVTDRAGHDLRYAIDSSKLRRELGWQPSVSFEEGLQMTVEWYIKNESWWRNVLTGDYAAYYEHQYGSRLGGDGEEKA